MPQTNASPLASGSKSRGLSRFLQSRVNTTLLRRLPRSWGRAYLGLLGRAYFAWAAREREAIRRAQGFCLPPLDPKAARARWRRTRAGIIDHYFEKLYLACRDMDHLRGFFTGPVKVSGLELLDQALSLNRGLILVTGHYGAVEFIPGALAFRGYPVTVMVHCKTKALWRVLEAKAGGVGVRLLDPKSKSVFYSAVQDLRAGRILVTQCDELDMWRPYRDLRVAFLGLELGLDRSLDLLARKARAPVLFGLNERRPRGQYELALQPPEEHPAARGLDLVSAQCLAVLAHKIYTHPEAWYEWKKLGPLVAEASRGLRRVQPSGVGDADCRRLCLSGQVAVFPADQT